jgi:hypothetical protein
VVLGVSRSSRRCFLVSSRRTGRIKSLAGTCRHFNEQWYINIQSPHMLHIEKVIEVRCAEVGLTRLHDFTVFSRSSSDHSTRPKHHDDSLEQQPTRTANSRHRTTTNTLLRIWKAFTTSFSALLDNANARLRSQYTRNAIRKLGSRLYMCSRHYGYCRSCQSTLLHRLCRLSALVLTLYLHGPLNVPNAASSHHSALLYFSYCDVKANYSAVIVSKLSLCHL